MSLNITDIQVFSVLKTYYFVNRRLFNCTMITPSKESTILIVLVRYFNFNIFKDYSKHPKSNYISIIIIHSFITYILYQKIPNIIYMYMYSIYTNKNLVGIYSSGEIRSILD